MASVGTSALLVAAAATSLLTLSLVFAINGLPGAQAAGSRDVLVLDLKESAGSDRGTDAVRPPDVLVADRLAGGQRRDRSGARAKRARGAQAAATTTSAATSSQIAQLGGGDSSGSVASPTPTAPPPAAAKPNIGDGVKSLGDSLSSTLQQTGSSLAEATAPLGAPVGAAVQQIVNVVAALLRQATNGLADLLGAHPAG